MSNEVPEEIDLNYDAVHVNQESVGNDLCVEEPASGAVAVTEGLVDGGVKEFGEDKVLAHRVDELGNGSKIEGLKSRGIDLEADMGSLGEVVDGKASVGLSSGGVSLTEVDGGSRGTGDGDEGGESVTKKLVEAEQMALDISGGVTEDLNVNDCPIKDSLVEGNSVRSRGDEDGDGDGESVSMEDKKPVEAEQMVVGSSGGLTKDLNVNDCPNKDSLVEGNSVRSRRDEDGDREIVSMEDKKPVEAEQMAVGSSGGVTEDLNVYDCPNKESLVEGNSVRSRGDEDGDREIVSMEDKKPVEAEQMDVGSSGGVTKDLNVNDCPNKEGNSVRSRGDEDGDGKSVFMEYKKSVEAEQMAMGSSGGVTEDLNVNDCPNKDSLVEGNSVQSRGDEDGDGESDSMEDEKPVEAEQMAMGSSGVVTEDLNVNGCPNKDSLVEGNSVRPRGDEDGDGESVSMEDKKPVEAEQMAVGSSGGVTEDLNVNGCPDEDTILEGTSVRSSSIVDNTFHSGDESFLPCGDQIMSSKEGFSAGSRETGDGESVSMEEKKPVEGEQMTVGSSGEVTQPEGLTFSECPNEDLLVEGTSVRSSSIADNTIHSGDEKPHQSSSPLGDQKMSLKEGSPAGLESCDMEIGSSEETKKSPATRRDFRKAGNRFDVFDDVVDLNQCTSSDEDASSDVDAKPEEPEFCVSDLVWAKVRSHPWWPAQISDRSAATPKAKKYFKKGCYLVAYYYDQTFAWNEASQIKPFRPHFSRMEKQTNMEEFHLAVDCALDEVSRRVEFGLACSCISEEAYDKVKAEIIVNAGIREESSRREGGDRFSGAASFDPSELVETMKTLALSPTYSEVDRLQFTISQAQLLAFNRWKGYSELPEFQNLHGLLETDAEIPLSEEVNKCSEVIVNEVPSAEVDENVLSEKEKPDSRDGSSSKQKKFITISGKKEKSLSEFLAERRLSLQNGKRKSNSKGGDKLMSSSPAKKLKAVEPVLDVSAVKQNKSNSSTDSVDKSLQSKQTFRVGASILKVASQLNGSTFSSPILKHSYGASPKSAVNNKSKGKASSRKSRKKKVSQTDTSSSDEMLS